MRKVTGLTVLFVLLVTPTSAQTFEYDLSLPTSAELKDPFAVGLQGGARGVSGPFDLDGDGKYEVLVSEYTGGGRVHVIEAQGPNDWQHVYSTPWMDSTAYSRNGRYATGGDLDGDGDGEIIFISGYRFSATNPNPDLVPGLYVFEFTGTDNDFGTTPASINSLTDTTGTPGPGYAEQIDVIDIDGDGTDEVLFAFNGASAYDLFYIYSVLGEYEPNGLGSTFETWVQEYRIGAREGGNLLGGGSAILMNPADLDGDGTPELSLHAWNNYNFFNLDVDGPNTYTPPDPADPNRNLQAAAYDEVSLVAAEVVDINQDGDDEVFYPVGDDGLGTGTPPELASLEVSVLNYEPGENVLSVTTDNLRYRLFDGLTELGIDSGDLDSDGNIELIGTGPFGYSATRYNDGESSHHIHLAEFVGGVGGDPEDANNYVIHEIDTGRPADTLGFNHVYQDSLGTLENFYRTAGGGIFAVKLVNLGDPDMDGNSEVALVWQGVDDSLQVIDRIWNADSTRFDDSTRVTIPVDTRIFMSIVEFESAFVVSRDQDSGIPSGFRLMPAYPNPFNPETSLSFITPREERVTVKVFDVMGRLVRTLINDERFAPGTHSVTWDGTDQSGFAVASGTYVYTLQYSQFRQSRKVVLLK